MDVFTPDKTVKGKDCGLLEKDYSKKINALNDGQQLTYFETKVNDGKTDLNKLEKEFVLFKDNIKTAENLLLKIENSADFEECDELKIQFLAELNRFLSNNKGYPSVEEKIKDLQIKPPVVKEEVAETKKTKEPTTKTGEKRKATGVSWRISMKASYPTKQKTLMI
ncbi:MAG: hypothetical protein R2764_17170 [Bacteroidales bacterium]